MLLRLCILFSALLAPASILWSDISVPKIFSDHMIVQRNAKLHIRGKASPGEKLTINFDNRKYEVVTNPQGRWSTYVATGVARGPIDIEIASQDPGGAKIIVKDVLIGDVWLCCGQDNMQLPVSEIQDSEAQISDAKNYPRIRLFDVKAHQANQPLEDFAHVDPWLCCSNDSIENFSALGFLFGKKLTQEIDTPIGLIDIARAGTTLEAWTPLDTLDRSKGFEALINHWKDQNEPNNPNSPGSCFNGMVSPLTGFPVAGVIWSQGEANVGRGSQYAKMFPLAIQSWRDCFNFPNMPFLFVLPAPLRYDSFSREALPEVWEAQVKTFNNMSNVGLVVTSDLANRKSVQITDKDKLAARLVSWALSKRQKTTVGPVANSAAADNSSPQEKSVELSGPIFQTATNDENEIVLSFKFAENGLRIDKNKRNEFFVCGPDQKFLPAVVEIEGKTLRVSHPDIAAPLAVRYGWRDTAEATLMSASGMPAAPFRTDNFPLTSEGINF